MSSDLFKENTPVFEQTKERDEEEILTNLVEELNNTFKRENLETNPYLVLRMNSSLEIPITVIYKDKKISSISTNLALIREAINRCETISYNKEREILRPIIKPMKNKILINKIQDSQRSALLKLIHDSSEYSEKLNDKNMENLKSYNIIMKNEESASSLVEKIRNFLGEKSDTELLWDYEDLYVNLVQKAQDSIRNQVYHPPETQLPIPPTFDPYGSPMNFYYPYMNPYMMQGGYPGYRGGYGNNMMNGFYNQMFIRKAQEDHYENDYHGGRHERKRDKYQKRGGNGSGRFRRDEKERKYISPEEIERRTAVNHENFPPLISEQEPKVHAPQPEEKKEKDNNTSKEEVKQGIPLNMNLISLVKKIHIKKDDIIKLFKESCDNIKPHQGLSKLNPEEIPVLELNARAQLEHITPTPVRKDSTASAKMLGSTPKQQAMTPKQQVMTPKQQAKQL